MQGESMLDEIARPELVATTCVACPLLLDIGLLDEAKIVQLAPRNQPYAAQNVVPVHPRREFVAVSRIGPRERANANVIKEHTEVNRLRTGCADNPCNSVN